MATAFDTATYPLDTETAFRRDLGTQVDRMDDNTVRLRDLTDVIGDKLRCKFSPQTEAQSSAFEAYLESVRTTELSITHNGSTYEGFIDGQSLDKKVREGIVHYWTFDFEAVVV